MKILKNVLFVIFLLFTIFSNICYSANKGAIGCTSITGENYSLDRVTASMYSDNMVAIVPVKNDLIYFYIYDSGCTLPESLPDVVIPNDNLSGTYPGNFAFYSGILLPDGRVFCVPHNSTTARITTSVPTHTFDLPVILGPTYNKL